MKMDEKQTKKEAREKAMEQARLDYQQASKPKKILINILSGVLVISAIALIIGLINNSASEKYKLPEHTIAYSVLTSILENSPEYEKTGFNEVDCPLLDYKHDYCNDSSYVIVSHFKYKTELGIKKTFNYKARIKWHGGERTDNANWTLMYIKEFTLGM